MQLMIAILFLHAINPIYVLSSQVQHEPYDSYTARSSDTYPDTTDHDHDTVHNNMHSSFQDSHDQPHVQQPNLHQQSQKKSAWKARRSGFRFNKHTGNRNGQSPDTSVYVPRGVQPNINQLQGGYPNLGHGYNYNYQDPFTPNFQSHTSYVRQPTLYDPNTQYSNYGLGYHQVPQHNSYASLFGFGPSFGMHSCPDIPLPPVPAVPAVAEATESVSHQLHQHPQHVHVQSQHVHIDQTKTDPEPETFTQEMSKTNIFIHKVPFELGQFYLENNQTQFLLSQQLIAYGCVKRREGIIHSETILQNYRKGGSGAYEFQGLINFYEPKIANQVIECMKKDEFLSKWKPRFARKNGYVDHGLLSTGTAIMIIPQHSHEYQTRRQIIQFICTTLPAILEPFQNLIAFPYYQPYLSRQDEKWSAIIQASNYAIRHILISSLSSANPQLNVRQLG